MRAGCKSEKLFARPSNLREERHILKQEIGFDTGTNAVALGGRHVCVCACACVCACVGVIGVVYHLVALFHFMIISSSARTSQVQFPEQRCQTALTGCHVSHAPVRGVVSLSLSLSFPLSCCLFHMHTQPRAEDARRRTHEGLAGKILAHVPR